MLDRLAAYMHCIAPPPAGGGSTASSGTTAGSSSAAAAAATGSNAPQPSSTAIEAECEALAEVLRLYLTASQCSDDFEGLQMATEAAAMLAAPDRQAAVARALRHLSAAGAGADEAPSSQQAQQGKQRQEEEEQQLGLPTLTQLRYACCHLAAESALQVAALSQQPLAAAGQQQAQAQQLSAEQQEAVQAAEDSSINELLELEPDNPKGLVAAALASGRSGQPPERVTRLYLSAYRLATEQRSDWWAALAAARALAHAAERPEAVDGDTLAEAVAAFQQAEPALKRCRRLLPPTWVQQLEASWDLAERLLPAAAQVVQQAAAQQESAEGEDTAAGAAAQANECAYCGETAAALRCARCRRDVYCSRKCQRSAWKKHKLTCQPA